MSYLDCDTIRAPKGCGRSICIAVSGRQCFGVGLRQNEGIISADRAARGLGAGQRVYALVGGHRRHGGYGVMGNARGAACADNAIMSNDIQAPARPRSVQLWARRALDLVW